MFKMYSIWYLRKVQFIKVNFAEFIFHSNYGFIEGFIDQATDNIEENN